MFKRDDLQNDKKEASGKPKIKVESPVISHKPNLNYEAILKDLEM